MGNVRAAVAADAASLHELEQRCFNYDQIGLGSFRRLLRSASALGFIIEHQGSLAGYAFVLTRSNSHYWRLYSMATDPAIRGQGLGRTLLEHILRSAGAAGMRGVRLEVKCDNQAALYLYRQVGFEVTDVLPGYYSDGTDGYKMQLSFDNPGLP